MATEIIPARLYINNDGPHDGLLRIEDNSQVMRIAGPRSDPDWTHVDTQGHWHARSEDEKNPYPTLRTIEEHVDCDGSCGGTCGGEGYTISHYLCMICDEKITPGSIPDLYQFTVPGWTSWSAEVETRLRPGDTVTVRREAADDVHFGIAQVADTTMGRQVSDVLSVRSTLVGIGPLGKRKAAARTEPR